MHLSENPGRPHDFDERLENIRFLRVAKEPYQKTITQLRNMAKGGVAGGLRGQSYTDWENGDFEDLLTELGESIN